GGTVDDILAHTATLTSTIAGRDKVIGDLVDNLNTVLDTVNGRSGEVNDLITSLQHLVSGLSADRKPIGDAISALGGLTDVTAGLSALNVQVPFLPVPSTQMPERCGP